MADASRTPVPAAGPRWTSVSPTPTSRPSTRWPPRATSSTPSTRSPLTPLTLPPSTPSPLTLPPSPLTLPPVARRQTSFSPTRDPIRYDLRGSFSSHYDDAVAAVHRFVDAECGADYARVSLVDGSNVFFLDHASNEWTQAEAKAAALRTIPRDHAIVILMKEDTFRTIREWFPIRRLLSGSRASKVCIVTVGIPFCRSGLLSDCLRRISIDGSPKLCSLARRHRAARREHSRPSPYARPASFDVTDLRHLYCEYDDVMLSHLYRRMRSEPQLVSFDRHVLKADDEIDAFVDFNPKLAISLYSATDASP